MRGVAVALLVVVLASGCASADVPDLSTERGRVLDPTKVAAEVGKHVEGDLLELVLTDEGLAAATHHDGRFEEYADKPGIHLSDAARTAEPLTGLTDERLSQAVATATAANEDCLTGQLKVSVRNLPGGVGLLTTECGSGASRSLVQQWWLDDLTPVRLDLTDPNTVSAVMDRFAAVGELHEVSAAGPAGAFLELTYGSEAGWTDVIVSRSRIRIDDRRPTLSHKPLPAADTDPSRWLPCGAALAEASGNPNWSLIVYDDGEGAGTSLFSPRMGAEATPPWTDCAGD